MNFQGHDSEDDKNRPANAPLLSIRRSLRPKLSPDALTRRCTSKGRGSLYDPIYGICCHFCRFCACSIFTNFLKFLICFVALRVVKVVWD